MFPVAELRSVMPAAAQAVTRRVEPLLAILRIDEQSGKELLQRFPTRVFDGHVLEANAAGEALIEIDGHAYRGQLSVPRAAGEQVIAKWVERLPTPAPAVNNGDATVRRPTATGTATEPEFYDYVYVRDNPYGPHRELWFHQGGCHEWLVVERDTRTHAIASAVPARSVFGAGGRGHVRISLTPSIETLAEALDRIEAMLAR